jgi:hypothetical protein
MGWHVFLYPLPEETLVDADGPAAGIGPLFLVIQPESLAAGLFSISFEAAVAALAELDRMFCELDGSFVWRGTSPNGEWQLDGLISERAGRVACLELKGGCPIEQWRRLLTAMGVQENHLVAQLMPDGRTMIATDFRKHILETTATTNSS